MIAPRTLVSLATLSGLLVGGLTATAALAAEGDTQWVIPPERPTLPALDYDPRPAVLYVPFEEVVLTAPPNCMDGSTQANSAKNCSSVVANETTFPAWGDASQQMSLMDGLNAALGAYDVRITNTRPDDYVPYNMLIMSDMDDAASEATICGLAGLGCDGVPRNQVALVLGSTMNCMDRDPVATALFLVGRLAGLEGVTDATDIMGVPLDPMNPASAFQDACTAFEAMDAPVCVSAIHAQYCSDMDGVQNSHQDLLGVYGPRPMDPDTTAPTIDSISPADGSVFQTSDAWTVTATASDDSGYYVAKWEWIEGLPMGLEDFQCAATNRACPQEFANNYATLNSPWDFFGADNGAPAGTYKFRFTVQDMAGNTASEEITVTVEGTGGTSGGSTSGGGTTTTTTAGTTTAGSSGGLESGGGTGGDDSGGGCSCRADTQGFGGLGALGLVVLGALRRRRRA